MKLKIMERLERADEIHWKLYGNCDERTWKAAGLVGKVVRTLFSDKGQTAWKLSESQPRLTEPGAPALQLPPSGAEEAPEPPPSD
jgi:hypothetical protein